MPKTRSVNENAQLCAAALRLAATQGWENVTLDKVAKAAKVKIRFSTTNDLVPIIAEEIDREAFASAHLSDSVPDRLFDLMMARFDILQKHRRAIVSMSDAARHDRALSIALARATLDGIYRLIEAAQIKDKTPPRIAVAVGVAAVYGWAFCVWRRDESRDMAKVMAAVDRGLRYASKAIEFFKT